MVKNRRSLAGSIFIEATQPNPLLTLSPDRPLQSKVFRAKERLEIEAGVDPSESPYRGEESAVPPAGGDSGGSTSKPPPES